MKSHLHFIIGGARSGKSTQALNILNSSPYQKIFFATCPHGIDSEMDDRISRHQEERTADIKLVENEKELIEALSSTDYSTVVMDCLTLWLYANYPGSWDTLSTLIEKILLKADLIIVSNEIGMGVVPADRDTREFRDILGHLHQKVARRADQVTLMVVGIPVKIK